ncbi:UDP-N-acetylglucosamine--LPS N-acetylglucosamine transferase [Pseudooceanicola algae]|nr:UDP-N-acetylglucosamine--LPS N-acetylglucosamine transferase [Pseudooceanicola algae]
MQLAPAFEGSDVTFASTDAGQAENYDFERFIALKDYNQNEKLKMLAGLAETFGVIRRLRPDVVISTGAAPGLLCLLWGRVMGARTIWVDSIANSQEMSLSGRLAPKFCHVVLTQWEHLATESDGRVQHWGSVL